MSKLNKLPGIYKIGNYHCYIYKSTYKLCGNTCLIAVNIHNGFHTISLTEPDDTLKLKETEIKVKSLHAYQLLHLGIIKTTSLSPKSGVYELCSLGPAIE